MTVENNPQLNAAVAGTVKIGETTINRMAFGTMRLTGPEIWGDPADPDEARRVLRRSVELGVNYFDTMAAYGPLVTDRLLVEALYPYPAGVVIGTKVGGWRGADKSWPAALEPKVLKAAVEDNLERLRLDALELVFYRYREGATVPFAEGLTALIELQEEGKIRNLGLSSVSLEHVHEAQKLVKVAAVQNLYNLVDRRDEEIVDYCTQAGIPFMPYFPLAIGNLGRAGGLLATIAQRHNATPAQIAIAWLLARSPQMVLIPGTTSVAHLEENIAAASIKLSDEERTELANSPEVASIPSWRD